MTQQQPPPSNPHGNNNGNSYNNNGYHDDDNNNNNGKLSSSSSSFNHSPSSRKETLKKKLITYRRNQVFSMSSQGIRQEDIAKALHVSQGQVSLDLNYLRARAKESLSNYLESRFPLYFEECLLGVSDVIREAWNIYGTPNLHTNDKVHVLHLINSANELKIDLCSNGSVIEEAIKFTKMAKNKLIEIAPEKANKILHEENNKNNGNDDNNNFIDYNDISNNNSNNKNSNNNNNNNNGKVF
jgi:hypothetical protein